MAADTIARRKAMRITGLTKEIPRRSMAGERQSPPALPLQMRRVEKW
jgi:hypothetical protein